MGNERSDFEQMEQRAGGGGAGLIGWLLILMLAVGVPVGYLVTAKAPIRPAGAVLPHLEAPELPAGTYHLFTEPDWARLRFEFRTPRTKKTVCAETNWVLGGMSLCRSTADPLI